ncbi:hypothetical protein BH23CHL2_BH23CHL2_27490 [soil metagenome]
MTDNCIDACIDAVAALRRNRDWIMTLTLTVAILTANRTIGRRLSKMFQSFGTFQTWIVNDEPDLSFRAVNTADIIVVGPDVPRSRAMVILRAVDYLKETARVLAVIPAQETVAQVLDYFKFGANSVLVESDTDAEFDRAIAQLLRGQHYLSPGLTAPLLQRYRELLAELRTRTGEGHDPVGPGRLFHCRW